MILKKIIIDGKVVYEPISYEEALAYPNKEELIFTSDDEKEEFEEKLEELEELTEKIEELDEKIEELIDNLDEVDSISKQTILSRLEEIKVELESYKDLSDEDLEEKLDSLEEELDETDDTIDELIDELDDEDDDQEDDDEPVKITINGKKINLGKDFGATFGKAFGNMFGGVPANIDTPAQNDMSYVRTTPVPQKIGGIDAIWIYSDGNIKMTEGIVLANNNE